MGAVGEGSGWDLRIRPAAPASGNLGTWKSGNLEIWECGDLGTWESRNLGCKKKGIYIYIYSQNSNPFCPIYGPKKQLSHIFLDGPMAAIHPLWAHILVSWE